jgi:hypothetical protein
MHARSSTVLLGLSLAVLGGARTGVADGDRHSLLPDGREFAFWEKPLQFSRTYYVDNRSPKASDANPGTAELPWLTINQAAQRLQPGERAVIRTGVYRERVAPARGGAGPEQMISYEAAPGATVLVKGSRLVKAGWQPSAGFALGRPHQAEASAPRIYQLDLAALDLGGYNPFGMVNILDDRSATSNIGLPPQGLKPYLARRGLVFADGQRLEQVELYRDLAKKAGAFWCEHNGLVLHLRLPEDANPAEHEVELAVQEQVFAPRERHLGYIRVKGITFEHGANGFPVPQRGLLSANRGHHWIIEDCVLRQANAVALDVGDETWNADHPALMGYAIVRRNRISDAGVCGLAGLGVMHTLVEDNTIERVGWQNVESMWESGAIKLHLTKSCLVRNNVIRHLRYAPGIWLDYGNANTRVAGNVIGDLQETLRGGIYLEASHEQNMLDHNIIWNVTMGERGTPTGTRREGGWGIMTDGSDEAVIAHNLLGRCENAGLQTRTDEDRIVEGRGGTSLWNRILNNIFYQCGRSVVLSHRENKVEGNLYAKAEGESGGEGRGLNCIPAPESLRLDLPAWQKYFGFDLHGAYADLKMELDLDTLKLTWSAAGKLPEVETGPHFREDFGGAALDATRKPGPFARIPPQTATIDLAPYAGAR